MKLAIVGAGPKALAIAAKASVLKKLGFKIPEIHLFEKNEVGAHWDGNFGYTSGNLPLGTPPEKDVGFSYHSQIGTDSLNEKINKHMHEFSWQSFLVSNHLYSDWIDRAKPAPTHKDWSRYLKWVFKKVERDISFYKANVNEVDIVGETWNIMYGDHGAQLNADGLVLTGPGETIIAESMLSERVFSAESFWKERHRFRALTTEKVLVVGSGETAAAIVACLSSSLESLNLNVMTSKGYVYTRGESYLENRVYSNPDYANWQDLAEADRMEFVTRTDRGVFSVDMQRQINHSKNIKIIPGHWKTVNPLEHGKVQVEYVYNDVLKKREFDYLIVATGGDTLKFSENLLSQNARLKLVEGVGSDFGDINAWQKKMDHNLAVDGVAPHFHLPAMAGLNQGPGFANLSCLGALSDRILTKYIQTGDKNGNSDIK